MTQCPVRAVPRQRPVHVTVHSHVTVQMSGAEVAAMVQRLRDARRQIRDEGDEGDGLS